MRLKMRSLLLIISLGMTFIIGCSFTPVKPDVIPRGEYEYAKRRLSWKIRNEMKKQNIKGISIALVDDQRIVWAEGFGFADVANQIPATPETVYRVASLSKLFTVTAAMQLAEQGKIDIDRALQSDLPEFSMKTRFENAAPITPRTLMTHHSGLPSDWGQGKWSRNPAPLSEIVTQVRDEYVVHPPNVRFSYSNLGMTLLGHLVERVSGRDFVSYTDEAVLAPLGMTHSSFALTPEIRPLLAKGYWKDKEAEEMTFRDLPAGALYSNVLDLGRFVQMMLANGKSGGSQILKPETVAEMLRPQNTGIPLDFDHRIGLGWWLADSRNPEAGFLAEHPGDMIFFKSDLIILPLHQLGVVVLANSSTAHEMVHSIAMEAIKVALETKSGLILPEPRKPVRSLVATLSQEQLKVYEGRYMTWAGPVSVELKGKDLRGNIRDKTIRLVPHVNGWFSVRYDLFGIIPIHWRDREIAFITIQNRQVVVLRDEGGRRHFFGEKIQMRPIPDAWLKRVGDLEVVNQKGDYMIFEEVTLGHEEGLLLLRARIKAVALSETMEKISAAFFPISETEGIILGPGLGMGETVRIITVDGEERLRYSGYEARWKRKKNAAMEGGIE